MAEEIRVRRGETAAHAGLKRLALVWAQANAYAACALEMRLPKSRYRADVAAFRAAPPECAAVFECKQALPDLRKDSRIAAQTRDRLMTVSRRLAVLQHHLRIHYPNLRAGDSLFPEFDSHRFDAIEHRTYRRVLVQLEALQTQLRAGTKFEKLVRYHCANVFYLVIPHALDRVCEAPVGWGVLTESDGELRLLRRPLFQETSAACRRLFLERIAACATREYNHKLGITFEEVCQKRAALPH